MPNPNYPATEQERLIEHKRDTIFWHLGEIVGIGQRIKTIVRNVEDYRVLAGERLSDILDEPAAKLEEAAADFVSAVKRALGE